MNETGIKRFLSALFLTTLSTLAACSTMQVQTAKDPNTDVAQYKTYAWSDVQNAQLRNPTPSVLDLTVRKNVDAQLAAKGLTKVPIDQAALLVSYTAVARNSLAQGTAAGPGPGATLYTSLTPTRTGALTIYLSDSKTHQAVWQGTAADVISEAGASQNEVAQAVEAVLKDFPAAG